jgi:hypothetical protein
VNHDSKGALHRLNTDIRGLLGAAADAIRAGNWQEAFGFYNTVAQLASSAAESAERNLAASR